MAGMKENRNDPWSTTITFRSSEIPKSVRVLNPIIFSDAPDAYCCYFGADFMVGVAGCGKTVLKAMKAFDKEFMKRLKNGQVPDWLYHDDEKLLKKINGKKKGTGKRSKAA